jgi:hypothetical protein
VQQQKTIYALRDEVLRISKDWSAECEERDTEVESSSWSATRGGLAGQSLEGNLAAVTCTVVSDETLTNTVELGNGETLKAFWLVFEKISR